MLQLALSIDRNPAGVTRLNSARMRTLTGIAPTSVAVTHGFQPDRERIQRFIGGIYLSTYGAVIARHYPSFISIHDADGDILAAAGFRSAACGSLYLEQYLSAPIEQLVGACGAVSIRREQIAEVGNLAASGSGGSLFLFMMLGALLRRSGFTHAAVTATQSLRRTFERFCIDFQVLAPARPELLADRGASWGRYFDSKPQVIVGSVAPACTKLQAFLPDQQSTAPMLHACEIDCLA